MPYRPEVIDWRSRKHPLNTLLHDLGSSGGLPTKDELDTITTNPNTRLAITQAARKIEQHRSTGDFQAARREAEESLGRIAPTLGSETLPEPPRPPEPISLTDLAQRMFRH